MSSPRHLLLGLASASLLLSLLVPPSLLLIGCDRPSPLQSDRSELIVYTTLRSENQDIYLVDGPEAEPQRMTNHLALDYNATFSPDGRWLVFTSDRDGNTDLYALNLKDDGELVRITRERGMDDAADISPDGEWIAFVSTRDGNADIFVMPFAPGDSTAEDGAENVTAHPADDFNPDFSPDGSMIAWARRNGPVTDWRNRFLTEVFLMASDGTDVRRLLGGKRMIAGSPTWSDDGESVYVHGVRAAANSMDSLYARQGWTYRIWSATLDGTEPEPLTSPEFSALAPAVHPSGRVAFNRSPSTPRIEASELYDSRAVQTIDTDGSEPRTPVAPPFGWSCLAPAYDTDGRLACHGPVPDDVTPDGADRRDYASPRSRRRVSLPDRQLDLLAVRGYFPDFLPENRIVYGEGLGPGTALVTTGLNDTERRRIFQRDGRQPWATAACHDGSWIAFNDGPTFAPVDEDVDIWKVRSDGTDPINLTPNSEANDAFPAWSPDCSSIAFRSGRSGDKEIYLMDADGSNVQRLTHRDGVETVPDLSPDGEWIVFATDRDGAGMKIWIQPLDGSGGRFLEPDRAGAPGIDMHPRFSPDGEWVAVVSDRGGMADEFVLTDDSQPYGDIWAVPMEGGEAVRLTDNKWEDALPRWGPLRNR